MSDTCKLRALVIDAEATRAAIVNEAWRHLRHCDRDQMKQPSTWLVSMEQLAALRMTMKPADPIRVDAELQLTLFGIPVILRARA